MQLEIRTRTKKPESLCEPQKNREDRYKVKVQERPKTANFIGFVTPFSGCRIRGGGGRGPGIFARPGKAGGGQGRLSVAVAQLRERVFYYFF